MGRGIWAVFVFNYAVKCCDDISEYKYWIRYCKYSARFYKWFTNSYLVNNFDACAKYFDYDNELYKTCCSFVAYKTSYRSGNLPPNQVITSLALILTFFIMAPTFNEINEKALQPYMNNQITQQVALDRGIEPVRKFMFKQTHEKELALFVRMAKIEKPKNKDDVPTYVLLPSFILSELKTAFTIGFVVYLPFLVIDIVVSSVLVSMGMMFLPPTMIALPFKLIMFVMVDGWYLVVKSLVESFVT